MKKSKYSDQQIISLLKEVELGAKVVDVYRKYGISEATYYRWKAAAAWMFPNLDNCARFKRGNAKLKKMYAELALVHDALQDC